MKRVTAELKLALTEAEQAIRNYCNFDQDETIPEALNFTWAEMAIGLLQHGNGESDIVPTGPLTSVKMGDTNYSFAAPGKTKQEYLDQIIGDFAYQLNKYRRLNWS